MVGLEYLKMQFFFPTSAALFYGTDTILETTPFGFVETFSLFLSPKLFDFDHERIFKAVELHFCPIKMKRK